MRGSREKAESPRLGTAASALVDACKMDGYKYNASMKLEHHAKPKRLPATASAPVQLCSRADTPCVLCLSCLQWWSSAAGCQRQWSAAARACGRACGRGSCSAHQRRACGPSCVLLQWSGLHRWVLQRKVYRAPAQSRASVQRPVTGVWRVSIELQSARRQGAI